MNPDLEPAIDACRHIPFERERWIGNRDMAIGSFGIAAVQIIAVELDVRSVFAQRIAENDISGLRMPERKIVRKFDRRALRPEPVAAMPEITGSLAASDRFAGPER